MGSSGKKAGRISKSEKGRGGANREGKDPFPVPPTGFDRCVSLKTNEAGFRKRNRPLSLLLDLGGFLPAEKDLTMLLNGSLDMILKYFGLAAGRIYLMDPGREYLTLAACRGLDPSGLERVLLSESFTGRSAREQVFLAQPVTDLEDRARAEMLIDKGVRVVICAPLISRGQVEGVMNLAGPELTEISEGLIDLLIASGNQIAATVNALRLLDEVREKSRELERQNEVLKFLSVGVLHDLKSPAAAVHGLTRRLAADFGQSLGPKGRDYCRNILNASSQVLGLIGELNAYISARGATLNLEEFSLQEILDQVREEFSGIFEERKIGWKTPAEMPPVRADRLSMSRVIRNLVENSLKYGGAGLSEISFGWREQPECHVLWISDDGVGVRAEDKEKLFDLFRRLDSARGTEGTGIGLAVVKETAARHGGRVWVEPGDERGVTFFFSLSKAL
ncbi:MAG: HAMP domain-containing sensor histidine kinase [Pseudomonadota bacterium]